MKDKAQRIKDKTRAYWQRLRFKGQKIKDKRQRTKDKGRKTGVLQHIAKSCDLFLHSLNLGFNISSKMKAKSLHLSFVHCLLSLVFCLSSFVLCLSSFVLCQKKSDRFKTHRYVTSAISRKPVKSLDLFLNRCGSILLSLAQSA
jgi:hypothetical protein